MPRLQAPFHWENGPLVPDPASIDAGNDRIIRISEVMYRTGLQRSTLYARMASGHFPKNISLGPRSVGWYLSDVNKWINSHRPAKPPCRPNSADLR